jgi:hypothetical protein
VLDAALGEEIVARVRVVRADGGRDGPDHVTVRLSLVGRGHTRDTDRVNRCHEVNRTHRELLRV